MFYQHNRPDCGSSKTVLFTLERQSVRASIRFLPLATLWSTDLKQRIELLLTERIELAGICRTIEKEHQLNSYMAEL